MCRVSMLTQYVRLALVGCMSEAEIRSSMPVKRLSSVLERRR